MHKDFCGWSLENINAGAVETKYIIEYVNNKKTWEKINYINDHYCELEPRQEVWELYSKREYNNISDALTFYMTWFISDKYYFIQLWEQIFVNGKMVLEQMIEPQGYVVNSMRIQIDKDMKDRLYSSESELVELRKRNDTLMAFIKRYHAEDMLKKFIETEELK